MKINLLHGHRDKRLINLQDHRVEATKDPLAVDQKNMVTIFKSMEQIDPQHKVYRVMKEKNQITL